MKAFVIMIAVALSLNIVSGAEWEFPADYKTSSAGLTKVLIDCPDGAIRFEPSNASEIAIHVLRIIRNEKKDKAEAWAKECKIDFRKENETLVATIDMPSRNHHVGNVVNKLFNGDFNEDLEILIRVTVPANIALKVETSSADVIAGNLQNDLSVEGSSSDIKIENIVGNCDFRVSSGDLEAYVIDGNVSLWGSSSDVHADDIKGDLSVSTSSGDGIIRRVKGNLKIETTSGDLRVSDIEGDGDIQTTSGEIIGENISGGVNAHTASGDIRLSGLDNIAGNYNIETISGDVLLETAPDFDGRLDMETVSGEISSGYTSDLDTYSDSRISGKTGDGSGRIQIVTTSGDIRLEHK
jgi:DUF4097 and DUF4098 domain-containing protein YvlB